MIHAGFCVDIIRTDITDESLINVFSYIAKCFVGVSFRGLCVLI